ncbi:MAG: hypothetical protein M1814_006347 [Vezdaea aestivalis]|nr:MAG: hypothetical protein M1814_006347 [Vezdaea aestivalis]
MGSLRSEADQIGRDSDYFEQSHEYVEEGESLRLMVRDLSAGLVEVVQKSPGESIGSSKPDQIGKEYLERGFLQFVHESARDFFLEKNGLELLDPDLSEEVPGKSHEQLSKGCITYLQISELSSFTYEHQHLSEHYDERRSKAKELTDQFPFLRYAVEMCFEHAAASENMQRDQSYLNFHFHEHKSLAKLPWPFLADILEPYRSRQGLSVGLIHMASEYGLVSSIKKLLGSGEMPNLEGGRFCFPLIAASIKNHKEIVKLLLENGADIHAKGNYGETALHEAASRGHEAIIKLLLENGADIHAKSDYGETALHKATSRGHEAIIKLLLENGADIHAKSDYGETALHKATSRGHEAIIKLLLENGADIHAKDDIGETALHWAASGGHEAIIKLLLENGADIYAKGNYGETVRERSKNANGLSRLCIRLGYRKCEKTR